MNGLLMLLAITFGVGGICGFFVGKVVEGVRWLKRTRTWAMEHTAYESQMN